MNTESAYTCPTCGESIVIPIDISAGRTQTYDEDCPVCCHPNAIHMIIEDDGDVDLWAVSE